MPKPPKQERQRFRDRMTVIAAKAAGRLGLETWQPNPNAAALSAALTEMQSLAQMKDTVALIARADRKGILIDGQANTNPCTVDLVGLLKLGGDELLALYRQMSANGVVTAMGVSRMYDRKEGEQWAGPEQLALLRVVGGPLGDQITDITQVGYSSSGVQSMDNGSMQLPVESGGYCANIGFSPNGTMTVTPRGAGVVGVIPDEAHLYSAQQGYGPSPVGVLHNVHPQPKIDTLIARCAVDPRIFLPGYVAPKV
jgi:hypothetical protein